MLERGAYAIEHIAPNGAATGTHHAGDRAPETQSFPIYSIDDIDIGTEPPWMIDRIAPARGLGVVFGLPKCFKTFLLSDALFHVCLGRPWAGRDVLQGAVAYVSSEGISGLRRRFVAMRRHYGVEGKGVPFAFIPAMPDLGHSSGDAEELITTVRAWLAQIGNPPLRAIALDTLARAMNGADENATKDMGLLVANAERIAANFECIVILVHHAGRAADGRSRGSNALDGAADVMWHVEKGEGQSRVTILAMKDGEDGLDWTFKLNPYYFDKEGAHQGPTSTCTVEVLTHPAPAQQSATTRKKRPLPEGPKKLLEIARAAVDEAGEQVRGLLNVPPNVRAISRDVLKRYARTRGYCEGGKPDNYSRALLSRDLKRLSVERLIGLTDQHLWLLDE
jgi:AAA domain